jgi:penicillin-binding protein 2
MKPRGEIPEFRSRYRYLVAVVGLTFCIVLGRLCQMQILKGERYLKLSENNFIHERRLPTVRGVILDRRHRPLVINRPAFDVLATPRFLTPQSLHRLLALLALSPEEAQKLKDKIAKIKGSARFHPLVVARDISRDQLAYIETHKNLLAGISPLSRAHRSFVHGTLAAHLLGYLGEITAEELSMDLQRTYQPGEMKGRFGVERMYEDQLRGVPGRQLDVVDARGHHKEGPEVEELLRGEQRVINPIPGIILS